MSNKPFTRATERFYISGVDLNNPQDNVKTGFVPILENLRSYTYGILQPRQGLGGGSAALATTVLGGKSPVHSVRRLNDPSSGTYARIVGTGNALAHGTTTFTQAAYNSVNLVLSGNPLTLIPYRPDESPESWMYMADSPTGSNTGYKINKSGTVHQIGLPPPTYAPIVNLDAQIFGSLLYTEFKTAASWNKDGTVFTSAIANTERVNQGTTTTTKVIYDDNRTAAGGAGWCNIILPAAAVSVLGRGTILEVVTGGPTLTQLIIHDVFSSNAAASLQVGNIIYDSGTSGLCTIVPNTTIDELVQDTIVYIKATVYARVLSVIKGPDDSISFRCSTGTTTIASADSLEIKPSVRLYDTGSAMPPGGGSAIGTWQNGGTSVVSVSTPAVPVSGTGYLGIDNPTAANIDLTVFRAGGFDQDGVTDNDYIHLGLFCTNLNLFTQGRVLFNCDSEATPSYTKNFFYRAFTPNDLTAATKHTQSAIDNRNTIITNRQLDNGGVPYYPPVNESGNDDPFADRQARRRDRMEERRQQREADKEAQKPIIPERPGIDDPARTQTGTGDSQWHELIFPRGELVRVGNDRSRGYNTINGFRIEFTVPTNASSSPETISINSLSMFGARPLDIGSVGDNYSYRFRYRCSTTGARSNYSPASSQFIQPLREAGNVGVIPTLIPEVDKIDIERFGGALTNWLYIGTTANAICTGTAATTSGSKTVTGTGTSFTTQVHDYDYIVINGQGPYQVYAVVNNTSLLLTSPATATASGSTFAVATPLVDKIGDDAAAVNAPFSEGDSNFQPWTIRLTPKAGTTASNGICGTMIRDSGSNFDTRWVKGTPIKVDGVQTTINRILSSSLLELTESLGTRSSKVWEIPEPTISGQPLPAYWGPYNGRFFACGDNTNPGTLYWTRGNNPDSTIEANYLEITATSEPLQGGCVFNGRCFVYSSERLFQIEEISPGVFIAIEAPGRNGLFTRWALTVADRMWYLDKDGIYQTAGGDPLSITDKFLRPLFAREGTVGVTTNGFNPPKLQSGEDTYLRLSYYDGYLYFLYRDNANNYRCLTYQVFTQQEGQNAASGWWPDNYTPGLSCVYGEEGSAIHSLLVGGVDGKLYSVGGTSDNGTAISWHLRTGAYDAGDRRATKLWGDFIVDADCDSSTIGVVAGINNYGSTLTLTPANFTNSTRTQKPFDISSGSEFEAKNIQLDLTGSSTLATPKLYLWEPSSALRPEASVLRATQWDNDNDIGDKFFQGIRIHANTQGVSRSVQVQYDQTGVSDTLVINHNGDLTKDYSFSAAFIAQQVRLQPLDGSPDDWQLYEWKWEWKPEPALGYRWESQQTSHGCRDFFVIKEVWLTLRSTSAVTLTITRTDDDTSFAYPVDPSGSGVGTNNKRIKVRVPTVPIKAKAVSYVIQGSSNTAFRLYKDDCEVLLKPWASEDQYSPRKVFGGPHGMGEVEI